MAWEKRAGTGRTYFYRKVRQGERVVSIYVANRRRARKLVGQNAARREASETLANLDEIGREVEKSCSDLRTQIEAALPAAGLHKHKGQLRKVRKRKTAANAKIPDAKSAAEPASAAPRWGKGAGKRRSAR